MSKYKIGDMVWFANKETKRQTIICPECFGTKALTVILGDGSQVSIECVGCGSGLENPRGYVEYWEQGISVKQVLIDRVEETALETEYGFSGCYRVKETELFDNKEDSEKRALILAEAHNKEELDRIHHKEKNNKNWSWNVHYYRSKIRQAEKDLLYYTAKLEVGKTKAKTEGQEKSK